MRSAMQLLLISLATMPLTTDAAPTAPGVLQLSPASYEVGESTPTLVVTVTRTDGKDGAVGTRVSTSDITAWAHQDYTPISVKVTFADGDATAKTVVVPILADTLAEGDQTLRLSLGSPSGGAALGARNTATVTILDHEPPPTAPVLTVITGLKQLRFSWTGGAGAANYKLIRSDLSGSGRIQATVPANVGSTTLDVSVHRVDWNHARYRLSACNPQGCTDSNEIDALHQMLFAVGYLKASNSGRGDWFGASIAMSADGNTLAVGAPEEDSSAIGIGGNHSNNDARDSGAVYVFARATSGQWSQQAYVKASNTGMFDAFGSAVALSADGNTLAVGAPNESVGPDMSGAVYVFTRLGTQWSEQAYLKASNPSLLASFGGDVALSADGDTLAVGALFESSSATGVGGTEGNDSAEYAGAATYSNARQSTGRNKPM